MQVVINGAGAAGTAIAKLLRCIGNDPNVCVPVSDVVVCDSKGAIHKERTDLVEYKKELLRFSNRQNRQGNLADVLAGSDVFIGVSKGGLLKKEDVPRWRTTQSFSQWQTRFLKSCQMRQKPVGQKSSARGEAISPTKSTICWLFPEYSEVL
jgi:hypothetical protein